MKNNKTTELQEKMSIVNCKTIVKPKTDSNLTFGAMVENQSLSFFLN